MKALNSFASVKLAIALIVFVSLGVARRSLDSAGPSVPPQEPHFLASGSDSAAPNLNSGLDPNKLTRTTQVENTGTQITANSVGSGPHPDHLHFTLHVDDGPVRMRLFYLSKASDALPGGAPSGINMGVKISSLFEWTETSSSFDGYTNGVDPIIKEIQFNNPVNSWRTIPPPTITSLSSGEKIYVFEVAYPNPDASTQDLLALRVILSDTSYVINASTYRPNSVKVDVKITGWNFTGTANNHLGMKVVLQSEEERNRFTDRNENGQMIGAVAVGGTTADGQPKVQWNWVSTVFADDVEQMVYASEMAPETDLGSDSTLPEADKAGETGTSIFYSFPANAPAVVYWDPEILGSFSSAIVPSLFALVATALVLIAM